MNIETQRQIDAADRQIGELVYELYGMTLEEIAQREGKSRNDPFRGNAKKQFRGQNATNTYNGGGQMEGSGSGWRRGM